MVPELSQRPVYAAGRWEIDLARRELRSRGVPVPLGGRAFAIVVELVQAAGQLVSKNDLLQKVWPGVSVEEIALRVHVAAIRKALGADRSMLETAVGRGYRLLGNWDIRGTLAARPAKTETSPAKRIAPSNIPAARFNLIGRNAAVAQLRDLLSAYRVVTLTGPGGIGKTALALEVARAMSPIFDGDSLIVELAALSDPDLVPSAVAAILGIKLEGEAISAESVARAIGPRELLLIIDNCEHVIDAVASFTEMIVNRCPHVTVFATSREVLRVDGEYVYRVPPLEVPAADDVGMNEALEHAAVQLFIAKVRELGSELKPNRENLEAITSICRRLDGIPLAIEFAAARAQCALDAVQRVARRGVAFGELAMQVFDDLPRHAGVARDAGGAEHQRGRGAAAQSEQAQDGGGDSGPMCQAIHACSGSATARTSERKRIVEARRDLECALVHGIPPRL